MTPTQSMQALHKLQDRLSMLLGCPARDRPSVVRTMLHRGPSEWAAYWLQFVVAVGIATLGLVLGSAAVVIGAMLIAPLMGPIVSFGMGLAVGSPFLVLRAGTRILASVTVAFAASFLIVQLLPFHELNAEIAARTSPTALDLLTAAFCAVAAVYSSMRPGSDVASTAAGTSIGISLVPPLCVSGYGAGTADWNVAAGAGLLFLTNLVAIVVVGTVAFTAAGFARVDVRHLESEDAASSSHTPYVRAWAGRLERLFVSRGGPWLRLAMPFALLAAVYVPLRSALDEVAWQIRTRNLIDRQVARLSSPIVHSRIRVERGTIDLSLILLGTTVEAGAARAQLDSALRLNTGVEPRVQVMAVPDAAALAGIEAAMRTPAKPVVVRPSSAEQIDEARRIVMNAVERRWPARSTPRPLRTSISVSGEVMVLRTVHLGTSLDLAAQEVLARALSEDLQRAVKLESVALPADDLVAGASSLELVARLAPLLEQIEPLDGVELCVSLPAPPPAVEPRGSTAHPGAASEQWQLADFLARYRKAHVSTGPVLRARVSVNGCAQPASSAGPADAGSPD